MNISHKLRGTAGPGQSVSASSPEAYPGPGRRNGQTLSLVNFQASARGNPVVEKGSFCI